MLNNCTDVGKLHVKILMSLSLTLHGEFRDLSYANVRTLIWEHVDIAKENM